MLAAMHVLAALGSSDQPLSTLAADYERYTASGEINSRVENQAATVSAVVDALSGEPGARVDNLDGTTVTFADGSWFNLRASNTEPLLRLNVEAATPERMTQLRDDVLALVRS
jgi:phosphomannomutase